MSRLTAELQRLYHPPIDADGRVRAMALTLGGPADWATVSQVWQAVQSGEALPAPAIAVTGVAGYQLWFSLEEAAPFEEAHAFLTALRDRYLGHVAPARIETLPMAAGSPPDDAALPGREVRPGQWSAFVAPDLAPIFNDTPWLDIPPSPEGQADLLSRVQRIRPLAWRTALARLQTARGDTETALAPTTAGRHLDPRHFLLEVMNDERVALALRIEAAKALLPHAPA